MERDSVIVPQVKVSEGEHNTYKLGDFRLKSGGVIPYAHIAYKTFGDPQSPAIIYPTWFSGCEWLALLRPSCTVVLRLSIDPAV